MMIATANPRHFAPVYSFTIGYNGDGESVETVVVRDHTYSRELATTNFWSAQSQTLDSGDDVVENLTPDTADISEWPLIQWVSNGPVKLRISNSRATSVFNLAMTDTADYALHPHAFNEGTLGKYTWDLIKPLLDAPGKTSNLYTNIYTGAPNPNFWGSAYDFSGVPLVRDQPFFKTLGGALVTPQHLRGAWHYRYNVGEVIKFASKTTPGLVIERRIVGITQDDNYQNIPDPRPLAGNPWIYDASIAVLDSPVPSSIKWYPVITDFMGEVVDENDTYLGYPKRYLSKCGIWIDQFRVGHLSFCFDRLEADFNRPPVTATLYGEEIEGTEYRTCFNGDNTIMGAFSPYASFASVVILGDSGHPDFIPLDGSNLALWTTITAPWHGSRPIEQVYNLLIQSADDHAISLGNLSARTGYTVTPAPDPSA